MKWPTGAQAAKALHVAATAVALLLALSGEPQCAAALARVLVALHDAPPNLVLFASS